MKTRVEHAGRRHGWDAPFWAFVVLGAISLGTLGCFGVAAAQRAPADIDVLTTDNIPPPAEF